MRRSLEKVAEAVSTNHRRMADCYQIMTFVQPHITCASEVA